MVISAAAQKSSEYMYGGRQPKFPKVELTQHDYLVKSTNHLWYAVTFYSLSSLCFLGESYNAIESTNYNSSKGLLSFAGFGCIAIGSYHIICIPINLNRAKKAANK